MKCIACKSGVELQFVCEQCGLRWSADKHIKALEEVVSILALALKRDERSMYERCPDCNDHHRNEQKCKDAKRCEVVPHTLAGRKINKALEKLRCELQRVNYL